MANFNLPYYCSNGGDGSVSVHCMPTLQEAEAADEAQSEGWGESSAGRIQLKVEDGDLYFRQLQYVDTGKKGRYEYVWVRVNESAN